MQKDHAYLGIAVDRNQLPTTSTRDATNWLGDLKDNLEKVKADVTVINPATNESEVFEDQTIPRLFAVGACSNQITDEVLRDVSAGNANVTCLEDGDFALISVEYNDLISGTITFLNIFLGIIQVFDYILVIPIVALSFVAVSYTHLTLPTKRIV